MPLISYAATSMGGSSPSSGEFYALAEFRRSRASTLAAAGADDRSSLMTVPTLVLSSSASARFKEPQARHLTLNLGVGWDAACQMIFSRLSAPSCANKKQPFVRAATGVIWTA